MNEELLLCPMCKKEKAMTFCAHDKYFVDCVNCGAATDHFQTEEEAANAWKEGKYNWEIPHDFGGED